MSKQSDLISVSQGAAGDPLFVDAANNRVGVKTASPDAILTVSGGQVDYTSSATGTGLFHVQGGASSKYTAYIGVADDGVRFGHNGSGSRSLIFDVNETERARIDASGNLFVGTTAGPSTSNFGTRIGAVLSHSRDSGSAVVQFYGNTGENRFLGTGAIQNTLNSYGAISDIKLKENVTDATPKLEKLNQVRVVNYNLIGHGAKQIGVIAQELEQIFPSMVEETPDTDAEGNDLGTTTKGVKYSVFVPMLIKAMQEQQAIIEALEARISALETN